MMLKWILVGLFIGIGSIDAQASPRALRDRIGNCYSLDLFTPKQTALQIARNKLTPTQVEHAYFFKKCIVPFLPGSASQAALAAARVYWWSLREGNLRRAGEEAFRYSNCHNDHTGEDHLRSDRWASTCRSNIWQVGIGSGQVDNYSDADYQLAVERVLEELGPGVEESDLLIWSATLAGFGLPVKGEADEDFKRSRFYDIVRAKGRLRKSWLLRNPLIATILVEDLEVRRECQIDRKSFCFSGEWKSAVAFSGGDTIDERVSRMNRSIKSIKGFFLR